MGRVDAVLELGVYIWDVAAGVQLVKAAGGITERFEYDAKTFQLSMAATNGILPITLLLSK